MPREKLAADNFGADAPWFLRNIPFFEIDDPEIQQIYYYRWKLYRSHIREIGPQGTTVLEFLPDVPWAREPFTDLNDSASFHIMEGRWLRDPSVVNSLIDHLYTGGGNDRHFSESIAAATEAGTLVTGDRSLGLRHLDTMQHIYNLWDDHFDRARNLYWIEPLLDATEYTISSIDGSGAGFETKASIDQDHNGFTGGYAFRPSINSYQYANALAIAHFARLAGNAALADDYSRRAKRLQQAVLAQLWNSQLEHFADRYQRSTRNVTAGDFIRGRELVGYTPWFFELPPHDPEAVAKYAAAWKHALSSQELGGPFGLRTVEPSYARYMTQYRYDAPTGQPECQWNGPSWPFQTSQALTAMANLLDDYTQTTVTRADYLRLLRQYTHQHYLFPSDPAKRHPDIQEDYNPDTGAPIVGLARSHHYAHSTYIDLIINGLAGIRPRADDMLEVNSLLPSGAGSSGEPGGGHPLRYFALQRVRYHGHSVSVIYDADGSRYSIGRGLSVFVDGRRVAGPVPPGKILIPLGRSPSQVEPARMPEDLAANPGLSFGSTAGPRPSASSASSPTGTAEAVDGRMWFFPEIANGWSPAADDERPWYAVRFEQPRRVGSAELYFFADGSHFKAPAGYRLEYATADGWRPVPHARAMPPVANGRTKISFPSLTAGGLRVTFDAPEAPATLRLVEFEAFEPGAQH